MKDVSRYLQIWYADNSCAGGLLPSIREWFDRLVGLGPLLGYVPEPTNCHLIVSESNMDNAKLIFCDTGVNIVTGGKFLGGTIGFKAAMDSFVSDKVSKWTDFVCKLSSMCISQPQSSYIG